MNLVLDDVQEMLRGMFLNYALSAVCIAPTEPTDTGCR